MAFRLILSERCRNLKRAEEFVKGNEIKKYEIVILWEEWSGRRQKKKQERK